LIRSTLVNLSSELWTFLKWIYSIFLIYRLISFQIHYTCIYSWLSLSRIRWTLGKIKVNRSSTQEELRKYRKRSLINDERETTRAKFWRAKTSIACPYSRNDFKHLVERLITSRYLFLCVWICLSVLFMFFSCCIVTKLHPSWHIFLCAILFIYNKLCFYYSIKCRRKLFFFN
jgi:hypothetical protein